MPHLCALQINMALFACDLDLPEKEDFLTEKVFYCHLETHAPFRLEEGWLYNGCPVWEMTCNRDIMEQWPAARRCSRKLRLIMSQNGIWQENFSETFHKCTPVVGNHINPCPITYKPQFIVFIATTGYIAAPTCTRSSPNLIKLCPDDCLPVHRLCHIALVLLSVRLHQRSDGYAWSR